MNPKVFTLFLDESGDHAYSKLEDESHRYLALAGIWINEVEKAKLNSSTRGVKERIWGPRIGPLVVFHREEIINKKGYFSIFRDAQKAREFDCWLLETTNDVDFKLICVVIDKVAHRKKYAYPIDPYQYCLQAVLDRYCGWLRYKQAVGKVVAEERGCAEDVELKRAYREILSQGTIQFRGQGFHDDVLVSKELETKKKKLNVPGLQLADMLANPMRRRILHSKGVTEGDCGEFGSKLLRIAGRKLNRNEKTGRVLGYGIIPLSFE